MFSWGSHLGCSGGGLLSTLCSEAPPERAKETLEDRGWNWGFSLLSCLYSLPLPHPLVPAGSLSYSNCHCLVCCVWPIAAPTLYTPRPPRDKLKSLGGSSPNLHSGRRDAYGVTYTSPPDSVAGRFLSQEPGMFQQLALSPESRPAPLATHNTLSLALEWVFSQEQTPDFTVEQLRSFCGQLGLSVGSPCFVCKGEVLGTPE